jgi:hypothetical protein
VSSKDQEKLIGAGRTESELALLAFCAHLNMLHHTDEKAALHDNTSCASSIFETRQPTAFGQVGIALLVHEMDFAPTRWKQKNEKK